PKHRGTQGVDCLSWPIADIGASASDPRLMASKTKNHADGAYGNKSGFRRNSVSGLRDRDVLERIHAVLNMARPTVFLLCPVHYREKHYCDRCGPDDEPK